MKTLVMLSLLMSSVALAEGEVAALRAQVPQMDAQKRGKLTAAIKPALQSFGAAALPQMIEAFTAPIDPSWTQSARLAWDASLLEAMGSFKDARARPLFQKVLADESRPYLVQRAAAEGLAVLGDADVLVPLIARDAVAAAIGVCRKQVVAKALAAELGRKPAEARAKLLVHSLADVGNAWAWQTLSAREEEQATRNEAARALVQAFVAYGGEVRQAASNALLVIDASATPALIAEAKASSKLSELDGLQQRLNKNPLR
jgi:hypothetical protein